MSPESSAAAALRRAFDRSFAELPEAQPEAPQSFLAIRIGGDPFAVSLSEVASLHVNRKIVPLPSRSPELLGLAGFRGALVPVYDLRALLGYPAVAAPGFMVLVRAPDLLGLAFDAFEAHVMVPAIDVSSGDGGPSRFVAGVVRTADAPRPLIRTASLIEAITRLAQSEGQ